MPLWSQLCSKVKKFLALFYSENCYDTQQSFCLCIYMCICVCTGYSSRRAPVWLPPAAEEGGPLCRRPTDYIPLSLEESSEFTGGLMSEEILQLNQRQPLHSPSDRLRLFSFTKRHLKLPFSRSRKQKDKDKPASPEKEPYKSLTPLK